VAVWLDGACHYVGGFGSASASEDQAVTEDTLFMIGSDTKKMTAALALQQVQAGRLTLDTPISTVLPDFEPPYAPDFPSATLHELLSHQGGTSDYTHWGTTTEDAALYDISHRQFYTNAYAMARPGVFYNYSNPNFSLSGLMDEVVSGTYWADRVIDDLATPLGMTHTHARKTDLVGPVSTGYGLSGPRDSTIGPVSFEDHWESAFVRPAGLVWSTAMDQCLLAAFLLHGDPSVLSPDLHEQLVSPHAAMFPDIGGDYGYGLMFSDGGQLGSAGYFDVPIWSHGGNTLSHTSTFYLLPEQDFALSILSNGYGDDFTASVIQGTLSLANLPDPIDAPATPEIDLVAAEAFVGTYEDPYNVGTVYVTMGDGGLEVQMPLLDELGLSYEPILVSVSTQVWLVDIDGFTYDLSFIAGEDGEAWMRNRGFVARRAPAGEAAAAAMPIDPAMRTERIQEALLRASLKPRPPIGHPARR